jgi:hypothetical protein
VTHAEDGHARPVLEELARLGARTVMLDLATLPGQARVSISRGRPGGSVTFTLADGTALPAEEIAAVWWRRPRPYRPHLELAPPMAAYASDQVHEAVSGVWGSLHCRFMNEPWRDERASHKPAQLAAAEEAGLVVPPTLVTSHPAEARAFLAELGDRPAIHKPLSSTESTWRPTRFVQKRDLERLDDLRFAPAILQAYVPGVDVRVTVVGRRLFATAIDVRGTSSPQDFRPAYAQARVEACTLPADVEAGVRSLVAALGLQYAAIDLRRTLDGRHFFLESNPSGQWIFLEERTGQPITVAVAEALAGMAPEVTFQIPVRPDR